MNGRRAGKDRRDGRVVSTLAEGRLIRVCSLDARGGDHVISDFLVALAGKFGCKDIEFFDHR